MNILDLIGKKVVDVKKDNDNQVDEGLRIIFEDGYVLRIANVANCVELLKINENEG